MTKLSLNYDMANLQPADANPVEANFNTIVHFINQELIERDGSVAMRQQLRLAGDPVSPLDATPKQYVDQVLPVGIIVPFGGAVTPAGGRWLACDGAEYQTADWPELFAVIGTNFVTGTPTSGRFNVPNLTNRFPMGAATIGSVGGSANAVVIDHTHTINHDHAVATSSGHSANHNHLGVDHLHGVNIATGIENTQHDHGITSLEGPSGNAVPAYGFGRDGVWDGNARIATGPQRQNHAHQVVGSTGAADRGLTTSGANVDHTHTVNLPSYTGTSGAASNAVSATNANLPPYLGMAFVIRAK